MRWLRSRGHGSIATGTSAAFAIVLVLVIGQPRASVASAQSSSPVQTQTQTQTQTRTQGAPAFSLTVTSRDRTTEVGLKADNALLSDVANALGKRLRATVTLGPSLRQERVTLEVADMPLESMLTSLAARVLIDYDLRQDGRAIPRDIYLLGALDPASDVNTTARGISTGLLITGNTEDVAPAPADDPLLVTGDRRLMSLQVRKQPLAAVVVALADVLGVQADIRYDATELVDLDVRNAVPEDMLPRLSRNLHLIVRVDLTTGERTLTRIVVERTPDLP